MAQQSMLKPTPIVYIVGDDISVERYNELIQKVGDWFSEIRNTKEPVKLAKQTLDACLRGVKPTDPTKNWDAAATVSLVTRVRMACRFDMDKMEPLKKADEVTKERKAKAKAREVAKREESKIETNYPREHSLSAGMDPTYGDDPAVFFTSQELAKRTIREEAMLKEFPQLDNAAQTPKLDMLLDLQLLFERLRFRNALADRDSKKATKATEREMQEYTKQIIDLEKSMGIDPVSVSKMQKEKEGGTIGDAVRRFEELGNYTDVRLTLFAEELLLAYAMYHQASPREDMGGYQLDEVGLFALTKCRVITCPQCHLKLFAGFTVEEIEAYLVNHGHLKLVPVENA